MCGQPDASDNPLDVIVIGVVFVFHILKVSRSGKVVIEDDPPVNIGHLAVVKIIFAVQIVPVAAVDIGVIVFQVIAKTSLVITIYTKSHEKSPNSYGK